MNDDLVERVASAIRETADEHIDQLDVDFDEIDWREFARAAISAVEGATPPVTGEVGELRKALKATLAIVEREREVMFESYKQLSGRYKNQIIHKVEKQEVAEMDAVIAHARATLSNTEQPS